MASGAGGRGLLQAMMRHLGHRRQDAPAVLTAGTGEAGPDKVAAAVAAGPVQSKGGGRQQEDSTKKTPLVTGAGEQQQQQPRSHTATILALLHCRKYEKIAAIDRVANLMSCPYSAWWVIASSSVIKAKLLSVSRAEIA